MDMNYYYITYCVYLGIVYRLQIVHDLVYVDSKCPALTMANKENK